MVLCPIETSRVRGELKAMLVPAEPLKEYSLELTPREAEAPVIDRLPVGKRSKLGGWPDWIQADATPLCAKCGEEMSFIAQIDSFEDDSSPEKPGFVFGDGGMLYVFHCFWCRKGIAIQQGY